MQLTQLILTTYKEQQLHASNVLGELLKWRRRHHAGPEGYSPIPFRYSDHLVNATKTLRMIDRPSKYGTSIVDAG